MFYETENKLKDGKLSLLSGSFNIFADRYETEEHTSSIFAHELTHAYEEFKRMESGSESMFDYARRIGYAKNTDRNYSSDTIRQAISNLVYYTTEFEIRAYVASIYGALKKNIDKIKNSTDAFEIIKNSTIYRNYIINGANLAKLWEIFDSSNAKIIEQAWYNATGEKKRANNVLLEIEKRYNKQWKKLKRTIAKIAYDVYDKYGAISTVDDNNIMLK